MTDKRPRRILVTVTMPLLVALCAAVSVGAGTAADRKKLPTIVFLGDSLTAGLGLAEEEAFPARVGEILAATGHAVHIVNGGVSGDTTAGGLRRIDWLLRQKPAIVVVWLGANDGLRGFPVEETERNLREIIRRATGAGARVLLCGMYVPPSYGPIYQKSFSAVFPRLARELHVAFSPFPLKDVAGKPELNLPDGIHPNPAGQRVVAAVLAKDLAPLLQTGHERERRSTGAWNGSASSLSYVLADVGHGSASSWPRPRDPFRITSHLSRSR
ncbi:MAG TPA: arylesterase [Thermoanaerobaculia bacterium]